MHERLSVFHFDISIFRYRRVQFAPLFSVVCWSFWPFSGISFGVSVPPITHRLFRWVQWVSSVTFATPEIHRNQLQVATCCCCGFVSDQFRFRLQFRYRFGGKIKKKVKNLCISEAINH